MQTYFLVCVRVPLVASDVTTTLKQLGLGVPLVANSAEEALEMLAGLEDGASLGHALVQVAPDTFATSALRGALDRMGAKVVLLHDDLPTAEDTLHFPVLTPPFFTEDLEGVFSPLRPSA